MVCDCNMESFGISLPVTMDKLRDLSVGYCSISEIKMGRICIAGKPVSPLENPRNICFSSLSKVRILHCQCLRELTWLMFAPNLKDLVLQNVTQLEDIINKEKVCQSAESGIVPFPKLVRLELITLPELKNIYWHPLPFPHLKDICVKECPNLKRLPLDSKSGTHGESGLILRYQEKEWIEGVEWEDEATKTRFLLSCLQEPSSSYSLQLQDLAKQNIVLKVHMRYDKCKTKALKISAEEIGVTAVRLEEEDQEKLVLEGHQVDAIKLAHTLRKEVGYTELLSISRL